MAKDFLFVEKYRPHKVSDCILPGRIKKVFQEFVNQGKIPHLLLSGTPGTGKTTVARAMCEEIGLSHLYINASKERGIDTLRTKIEGYAATVSLSGTSKVIILDEADYLTPEAQAGLRGVIELYSSNCTFIFTCNFKARLMDAIHSRCIQVDFKLESKDKPAMASTLLVRLEDILRQENISFERTVLVKIIEKNFPDYRRTLNEVQKLATTGSLDQNSLALVNDVRKLPDLVEYLKNKDFGKMRKWVVDNSDVDPARIFREIYDGAYSLFNPVSIPASVLIIARYQYQAAFVADQEINLVACLTEIMLECEFI